MSEIVYTTQSRSIIRNIPGGFTMEPGPDLQWHDIREDDPA